jgi:hypothetical protein
LLLRKRMECVCSPPNRVRHNSSLYTVPLAKCQLDRIASLRTSGLTKDRQVRLVLDGDAHAVDTGIPQGFPAAPILFVTYLSGIFEEVRRQYRASELMMWHGGRRVRMTGRSRNG